MSSKDSIHSSLIPENVEIRVVVNSDFYTEGPVIDKGENIYFTTLVGGKIMKITPVGSVSVWAETHSPNGQRILSNGYHLVCDSKAGKVIRIDPSGKKVEDVALGECGGITIRAPNDLVVDEGTGFYFTDSVRHTGAVFFIGTDGSKHVVAKNIDYPNGICLSKNRTKLFIAESYKNRILIIELKAPGIPAGVPQIFCELPWNKDNPGAGNLPDGIIIDDFERIWIAHYGMQAVQVVSSQGTVITSYDTGIPLTSNLCFTKDKTGLIVTGGCDEPGPGKVHLLFLGYN